MDWVTIEKFWSVEEAQLALGFLQSNGIRCRLDGEACAGNFWHLSNATGGVKLEVAAESETRARTLLKSVPRRSSTEHAADEDLGTDQNRDDQERDDSGDNYDAESYDDDADDVEDEGDDGEPDDDPYDDDVDSHQGTLDGLRRYKVIIILMFLAPTLIGIVTVVMHLLNNLGV